MMKINWNQLAAIPPDELSDEDKDELYNKVVWFDIDKAKIDMNKLKLIFKVAQEILKYKSEQVESLITELDEIAAKQGEIEVQKIEKDVSDVDEDTKQENLQLKSKIEKQNAEIEYYKQNTTKLTRQIDVLEHEKSDLQSELQSIQHDNNSWRDSPEPDLQRERELTEALRDKNKHITQLLTDIEVIEQENIELREKLIVLRDELSLGAENITQMTNDLTGLKNIYNEQRDKITNLEDQNATLTAHINELLSQKQMRNEEINKFSAEFDSRVDDWKKLLNEKNAEIEEWKLRFNRLSAEIPNYDMSSVQNKIPELMKTIQTQEDKIEELQTQLEEAIIEMNQTTETIKRLQNEKNKQTGLKDESEIVNELQIRLKQAHERVQNLQTRVENAEEDAQIKAEEVNSLLTQIKEYEGGHYGLPEAVLKIQDLQKIVSVRDKQITELVQTSNKLQIENEQLEQQVLALRNKLGIPLETPIHTNSIISKQQKQAKLIQKLQAQTELLEDEKVQLKYEIHKLNKIVATRSDQVDGKPNLPSENLSTFDGVNEKQLVEKSLLEQINKYKERTNKLTEKLDDVVVENESLRKGLHEILESIQNQQGEVNVEIKSQMLERLLKALDVRHVSGWYHPAMRLQAELHSLQGGNTELRNQLKTSKLEAQDSLEKLQKAEIKSEQLEEKIASYEKQNSRDVVQPVVIKDLELPLDLPLSSGEVIYKLNAHLLHVLNEYSNETEKNISLNNRLEKYKKELNVLRHQMGLLYDQYFTEKNEWKTKTEVLEQSKDESDILIQTQKQQLEELKSHLEIIKQGDSEIQKRAVEMAQQCSQLIADKATIQRKFVYAIDAEKRLGIELNKLKTENLDCEIIVSKKINELKKDKEQLNFKIESLENSLKNSVPLIKYDMLVKEFTDVNLKYRMIIEQSQNDGKMENQQEIDFLKSEISNYKSDKEELNKELLALKIKRNLYELSSGKENDENSLAKRLAEIEIKEVSEKQRANHAEGLFKVIQEQLRRSEERFADVESHNGVLLQKNLQLQQSEKDMQDMLIGSVNENIYKNLKGRYNQLQREFVEMEIKNGALMDMVAVFKKELNTVKLWKSNNEYEVMSLKHQLLDLQAVSDDKATIAKLGTDVVLARIHEAETNKKLESLKHDLQSVSAHSEYQLKLFKVKEDDYKATISDLNTKCLNYQNVISSFRQQYLGSVPLLIEEKLFKRMKQITVDSQTVFMKLQAAEKTENDVQTLQEELSVKIKLNEELQTILKENNNEEKMQKTVDWIQEKNRIILSELKIRRHADLLEKQLQESSERLLKQEEDIHELERQLFEQNSYKTNLNKLSDLTVYKTDQTRNEAENSKRSESQGTQTIMIEFKHQYTNTASSEFERDDLDEELKRALELVTQRTINLKECEFKVTFLEKTVHDLRKELTLKQEELMLVQKSQEQKNPVTTTHVIDADNSDELVASLNANIATLKTTMGQKDEIILHLQALLKEGKDEHSRAASRLQEELQKVKAVLQEEQSSHEKFKQSLNKSESKPALNRAAVEKYIQQVHELETHIGELHTAVYSLNSQLESSRQEAVRWRTLAEDRLKSMDELRSKLEEQHRSEIETYKSECQQWQKKANSLQEELSKHKMGFTDSKTKEIEEKNYKIQELEVLVAELTNQKETVTTQLSPKVTALEFVKQQLQAEHEALKRNFNQLSNRERSAREEIRNLRGQLINRPALSARSDKFLDKQSMKEQYQKKIASLETEIFELKEKLEKEKTLNESRKIKTAEELALWDKQKRWQQTAEKLKDKLKLKCDEIDKLTQNNASLKTVITRLEREKGILESKLKFSKGSQVSLHNTKFEILELENARLLADNEALAAKLDIIEHHSNGVGAVIMEEKLEEQERKIAILELASKGTNTLTSEIERLQGENNKLHKENLKLESANLELKLNFEKTSADAERLQEQVEYLERYVAVLKSEQTLRDVASSSDSGVKSDSSKKTADLEKTVFVLKRIIEKLQTENKRLQTSRAGSAISHHQKGTDDKWKSELCRMKEEYNENIKKTQRLEIELIDAKKHIKLLENSLTPEKLDPPNTYEKELNQVKAQLKQKSELLDKVKVLLHRAAAKEKTLQEQVASLKRLVPSEDSSNSDEPSKKEE